MKKITTVFFAILLLTISFLAAQADQEGNVRWCNIDSDGCYLNEEGGTRSYMYFWTVESCRYFMGNDHPCNNVVPFYTEDKYRHPLDPAPEPVEYHPQPAGPRSVSEWYELFFPNGISVLNGALILTGEETGAGEVFTDIASASGSELLIPVFMMSEEAKPDLSGAEGVTLSDFLQVEVFGSTGNARAAVITEGGNFQSGVLVEDVNSASKVGTLMGYVPAEAVGLSKDISNKGKGLSLSAEDLIKVSESKDGGKLLLGLPENSQSRNSGNNSSTDGNTTGSGDGSGNGENTANGYSNDGKGNITAGTGVITGNGKITANPDSNSTQDPSGNQIIFIDFYNTGGQDGEGQAAGTKKPMIGSGGISVVNRLGKENFTGKERIVFYGPPDQNDPNLKGTHDLNSGNTFVVSKPLFGNGEKDPTIFIENDHVKNLIGNDQAKLTVKKNTTILFVYPISGDSYNELLTEASSSGS